MAKANKRRHCPALGGEITPVDCGEDRNRRHACPMDCPHNPFNPDNYTQLLEIEDRLDAKTMDRLANESRDRFAFQRETEAIHAKASMLGLHVHLVRKTHLERDAAGATFAQRWEKAGYAGLRNDERALFAAKAQMRVSALEIQRVIDHQLIEAVDLLAPQNGTLRLVDRSLAARATRFTVLMVWTFPLRHFWRPSGPAIVLPDTGNLAPGELLRETLRHLGAPLAEPEELKRWAAENYERINDSFNATGLERRRLMFTGADAELCEGMYDLPTGPNEVRRALAAAADVERGALATDDSKPVFTEAWTFFEPNEGAASSGPVGGRRVCGRLLLGPKHGRLEAMGHARYDALRVRVESLCGGTMRFSAERRQNVVAQMLGSAKSADLTLVPPSLLDKPLKLEFSTSRIDGGRAGELPEAMEARLMQASLARFSDEKLPALSDHTPREAAAEPGLRPALVELVKSRVRQVDENNLRTGRSDDINWLIRELGLAEIDFPAPPPRDPPQASDAGEDDEDDEDFDDEDDDVIDFPGVAERRAEPPQRMRAPGESKGKAGSAPTGELSIGEASDRMAEAMGRFETPSEALAELEASGSEMLEDLSALTAELLTPDEFGILITLMLPVWFAMVPAGSPAPVLDYDQMEEAFDRDYDAVEDGDFTNSEELMQLVMKDCPQPGMLMQALGHLYSTSGRLPKKLRPGTAAMGVMALAVKTVLTELDRSQRG